MNSEKRNHERQNLVYEQVPGKFHIAVNDSKHEFNQVNDVSVSGMGILMSVDIEEGVDISINYEDDDFSVSLDAEVVWREKLSDGVFRLGVSFSHKNMDDNIMLFMTLREYIDDFGERF